MSGIFLILLLAFPTAVWAKTPLPAPAPVDYGVAYLCPSFLNTEIQVYSADNQAGSPETITFTPTQKFVLKSDNFKNLHEAGIKVMRGRCNNGWPALRLDAKTDRWYQMGNVWVSQNEEWNYVEWADEIQKAFVLHPVATVLLYEGNENENFDEKQDVPRTVVTEKSDLRVIKFQDDYVLVQVGKPGVFGSGCTAPAASASGKTGWIKYIDDAGKPVVIPRHLQGC